MDVPTVNVFGSCISRNPFNYTDDGHPCKVEEYIHKSSPLFISRCFDDQILTEKEVSLEHDFIKRSVCTMFNGTAKNRLLSRKGKWIVLDNFYFDKPLYEIRKDNGRRTIRRVFQFPIEVYGEFVRIVETNRKYSGYKVTELEASPNYTKLVPELAEFLNENWKDRIIIIDSQRATKLLTSGEDAELTDIDVPCSRVFMKNYATNLLIRHTGAYYIPLPSENYSSDGTMVHYPPSTYRYLLEEITSILEGSGTDRRAYQELQYSLSKDVWTETLDRKDSAYRIENAFVSDDPAYRKEMFERCKALTEQGDRDMYVPLARFHAEGIGTEKDPVTALECLVRADRIGKAGIEIVKTLRPGPEDPHAAMWFMVLQKSTVEDLPESCIYLARAYRNGIGTPRDADKAIEWFRKGVEKKMTWAIDEYLSTIWGTDHDDLLKETVLDLADKKRKEAYGYLAKMYREGRCMPVDLEKAEEFYDKAYDRNLWAVKEYMDLLWSKNTPEGDARLMEISMEQVSKKRFVAHLFLGRMYRDGRGTSVDLEKAREHLRLAADSGIRTAAKELDSL